MAAKVVLEDQVPEHGVELKLMDCFDTFLSISNYKDPNIVTSTTNGLELALSQCQEIFQWDKWNCPRTAFNRQRTSTKETAFVQALTAAGIVYAITKNCSRGQIEGCRCNRTSIPDSDHSKISLGLSNNHNMIPNWPGCSDDTHTAVDITKKVLHDLDKGLDPRAYVSRHNQKVGIEVIKRSMEKKCRCHGTTGACTLQTCWMVLPPFQKIGKKLKNLHKTALRVTSDEIQRYIIIGNSATRPFVEEKEIRGTKRKLIYLDSSPDYCVQNTMEGIPGTKGRMCSKNNVNVTKSETSSCQNLCKKCGYRIKQTRRTITRNCNCTFSWCCTVKCDTCEEVVDEYWCN
ncbi:protein Wnt-8a-like [Diorhabda sublineata]|uniref:protein Wnt-8a-like n=1 Tax=Diorhabda sublineata TaxID=1163346 RepID=UPI0024E114EC|nr:protein Wnt-8a-like [Diorhabda sublineata]